MTDIYEQAVVKWSQAEGAGSVVAPRPRPGLRGWAWARAMVCGLVAWNGLAWGAPADGSRQADDPHGDAAVRSQPMRPVSGSTPPGLTRFTRLHAGDTGLTFVHQWDDQGPHQNVFDNAMAGGGVAIGDADGDGLPDVYLTRPWGGGRLYRNLGSMRFEDVTDAAGLNDDHWGGGAGFADIDNDGDLDLVVCGYQTPNRLYLNRGDGTFTERAGDAGLAFSGASVMITWADYDRDGDLDAYLVTNRVPPPAGTQVPMWRRNGRPTVGQGYEQYAQFLTLDDGRAALVRAGQADVLYRNNGDGTFTDVTASAGIAGYWQGLSAIWWDPDADGWPDLYVANDFFGPERFYRNNGDGTFTDVSARALSHTPWFAMGSDIGDINNDGRMDLVVGDMAGTSHYQAKLSMGDMADSSWFLTHGQVRQVMHNALYLNTGAGRMMEIAAMAGVASTDWTWAVKFGDLDNDGWIDLFFANGMTRDWFNSDLRARAQRLGAEPDHPMWRQSPPLRQTNLAFRNAGDLRFDPAPGWGLNETGISFGAAYADLDRDGDLDLVVNDFGQPAAVYRNDTSAGHRVLLKLRGVASNRDGIGARVRVHTPAGTQVRELTQSQGFMSANEPIVHFGLGDHARLDRLEIHWPSGIEQVLLNLPADRLYTLTEPAGPAPADPEPAPHGPQREAPDAGAGSRGEVGGTAGPHRDTWLVPSEVVPPVPHHERPYDDFARQPLLPLKLSQLGPGMAWGDVDGDGWDDLFVGGAAGQPGRLLKRRPGGAFEVEPQPALDRDRAAEDMGALLFDADGDGDVDLYVVSGGVEGEPGDAVFRDRLYLNDGSGRFTPAPHDALPKVHDSGQVAVAADFDRDGDLDLFVGSRSVPGRYPLPPESRLLVNDGSGRFTDQTDALAPGLRQGGMVTSAVWSDADGDGWIDLVVAYDWGPVAWFRNDAGRLTDATGGRGLASRRGWWNGVAAADLDHDGDTDYLVTNLGLNTKYHASGDRPLHLYFGRFAGEQEPHLIEASYEGGTLYPVRGRSCSTAAIPGLAERLPTFHDFALATLTEVYPREQLDEAYHVTTDTLESGVLLNLGGGRFRFQPLPRLAQASPAFGVILEDLDGDGHHDAVLAQNFFHPQPETTRMDSGIGLLLRGRGDGTFTPVAPDRSGIVVPADAKALTVADLQGDGRPDLVLTTNDGPVLALDNRTPARGLTVRLVGAPGNPHAIGASVRVHLADGTTRLAESYAGHGYLSQSPARPALALPADAQVLAVSVRWPDGATTRHDGPGPTGELTLHHPRLAPPTP